MKLASAGPIKITRNNKVNKNSSSEVWEQYEILLKAQQIEFHLVDLTLI